MNFDLDPDAVRILLESDIPLVLIPFETAHDAGPFSHDFFYWRDPYGVQWEMEGGRKRGYLRGL